MALAAEPAQLPAFPPADPDGAEDFQCATCGYGAVLGLDRPHCPMCRSNDWIPLGRSEHRGSGRLTSLVRAAGGVITRRSPHGDTEILLVHRPAYDDWTLPKGKAIADESDEACALREVEEETGLVCDLGGEVAVTEYHDSKGRPKRVRYFAMTPREGSEAAPCNEVDAVRWLSLPRARETLTYARDLDVVAALEAVTLRTP